MFVFDLHFISVAFKTAAVKDLLQLRFTQIGLLYFLSSSVLAVSWISVITKKLYKVVVILHNIYMYRFSLAIVAKRID